jgi:hypothetical protein
MRIRPPTLSGVAIGAVVVLIVTAATATAAALITGADIKDNTVASADLKNNNVASADLKDGTVSSADLKNNNIASGDIKDGTVSSADIKNGTIAVADLSNSLKTTVELGTFGPVHLVDQPDHGCATDDPIQAPWARDTQDRFFTVEPAEDGTGFIVTRYDVNGTFRTVVAAQHPGCADPGPFTGPPESGTWNGVWTQKISGNFDYNPDAAMPADPSWDNFIAAVFTNSTGPAPTVTFLSYEFDYYLPCADAGEKHWRDANYGGVSIQEGTIGDC